MRITNRDYSPLEVLAELAVGRGITQPETKEFFSDKVHSNHDWLVGQWAEKLDVILDSFMRYGTEVAETQFIRDHGVDVRMKFQDSTNKNISIGFQIKSNNEANNDANRRKNKTGEESLIATIKRQAFEAERYAGVSEWWLVCGFDLTKHQKLMNAINAEIGSGQPGKLTIKILNPKQVLRLIRTDEFEIDALTTLLLCKDDEVLSKARYEISVLKVEVQNIVLETLGPALENKIRTISVNDIESYAYSDAERGRPGLVNHVNNLESMGYLENIDGENFEIDTSVFLGLSALYYEARARHKLRPSGATSYIRMLTQLNVK